MSVKHDNDKVRLDLIDPQFIVAIGKTLTFGAKKYGPNQWQTVEDATNRYYAALLRHVVAWRNGEKKDKESKLPHLFHAATNLMFLMWFDRNGGKENANGKN